MRTLPMFPLGTPLLPYAALPLHVFEPRYRALVRDVLDGDGELGIVLIERGSEVGGGDVRFGLGTLARVVRVEPFPDGRFALLLVGVGRLRVVEWLPDDPYPRATVEALADGEAEPDALAPRLAAVATRLDEVVDLYRRLDPRLELAEPAPFDAAAPVAAWEACARSPLGALDVQRLLGVDDPAARLDLLVELLDDQLVLLRARFAG